MVKGVHVVVKGVHGVVKEVHVMVKGVHGVVKPVLEIGIPMNNPNRWTTSARRCMLRILRWKLTWRV